MRIPGKKGTLELSAVHEYGTVRNKEIAGKRLFHY